MNAKRFNQLYPPGTRFMHIAHRAVRGGRVVKLLHLPEILNVVVWLKLMSSLISLKSKH